MKGKHTVDEMARRQMRKLVGADPSHWDEAIAAYAKSEHVNLPELLDMVMDATRAVHGVAYHPRQNDQVVRYVLEQLDQRELHRKQQEQIGG